MLHKALHQDLRYRFQRAHRSSKPFKLEAKTKQTSLQSTYIYIYIYAAKSHNYKMLCGPSGTEILVGVCVAIKL